MSKKIEQSINVGLWVENAHGIIASAFEDTGGYESGGDYILNFHRGEMPAHGGKRFRTLAGLEGAMREFEPDLRRWRIKQG